MKRIMVFAVAAIFTAFIFTNCKKEEPPITERVDESGIIGDDAEISGRSADRIDAIMKDLDKNNYSLSFNKAMPDFGITRTAYGADNYLVFADPQDLICPDPIIKRFKKVPIWRRPAFIWPTCPDMIPDIFRLKEIRELLIKADIKQFGSLKEIQVASGGGVLAGEQMFSQFRSMKLDKIDDLTKDLNPAQYIMLNEPGRFEGGFTRNFYGYADINEIVFKKYKRNLKDLLKPTLKGCYDPLVLSEIRKRLQKFDPVAHKFLVVTPLAENKNIAVLQNQY